MPHAYVVPFAKVSARDAPFHPGQFRDSDPHLFVLMEQDPFVGTSPSKRQPFTPATWIHNDPDRPGLQVRPMPRPARRGRHLDAWMERLSRWSAGARHARQPRAARNPSGASRPAYDQAQLSSARLRRRVRNHAASALIWIILCGIAVTDRLRAHRSGPRRSLASASLVAVHGNHNPRAWFELRLYRCRNLDGLIARDIPGFTGRKHPVDIDLSVFVMVHGKLKTTRLDACGNTDRAAQPDVAEFHLVPTTAPGVPGCQSLRALPSKSWRQSRAPPSRQPASRTCNATAPDRAATSRRPP